MKSSTDIFPVLNKIYNLKFSEEQLAHLTTHPSALIDKNSADPQGVPLSAVVRSGDTVAVKASAHSSYDNDKILFFKVRGTQESNESEFLFHQSLPKKYKGYYVVYGVSYTKNILAIIDKVTIKDLTTLNAVLSFLALYANSTMLTALLRNLGPAPRFKTVKAFISALGTIILESSYSAFTPERYRTYNDSARSIATTFFKLLFPTAKHTFIQNGEVANFTRIARDSYGLCIVTDVVEINNTRYAISAHQHTSGRPITFESNSNFFIIKTKHDDKCYDYVDAGRFFISTNTFDSPSFGTMMLIDPQPVIPKREVIEDFEKNNTSELPMLATNADIGLLVKRLQQKLERQRSEEKAQDELNKKLESRLEYLKEDDKFLNINGIIFRKSGITYEKQILTCNDPNPLWVHALLSLVIRFVNLDTLTFDHVFPAFIKTIISKVNKDQVEMSGTIGEVTFKITRTRIKNAAGVTNVLTYINGIRVNFEEASECLERALCFIDQKSYNYFLSEVSKCSLKIHKYLQRGVSMNVRDEFNNCSINMKLPLVRSKNINYLVIEGKKFKVKDSHKIIELTKARDLVEVLNVFMNPKILEGMDFDQIKALVKAAEKEFITAIEKSQKLLKDTEARFGLTLGTYTVNTGHTLHGYIIKGKLDTYLLEVDVDDPEKKNGVYRYPSGQYICIVDKSAAQVGMDKVVNRIYALHNDSMLANQIHTLK